MRLEEFIKKMCDQKFLSRIFICFSLKYSKMFYYKFLIFKSNERCLLKYEKKSIFFLLFCKNYYFFYIFFYLLKKKFKKLNLNLIYYNINIK